MYETKIDRKADKEQREKTPIAIQDWKWEYQDAETTYDSVFENVHKRRQDELEHLNI